MLILIILILLILILCLLHCNVLHRAHVCCFVIIQEYHNNQQALKYHTLAPTPAPPLLQLWSLPIYNTSDRVYFLPHLKWCYYDSGCSPTQLRTRRGTVLSVWYSTTQYGSDQD